MNSCIHRTVELDATGPGFIETACFCVVGDPQLFIEGGGEHSSVFVENTSENPNITRSLHRGGLGEDKGSDNAGEHYFRLPVG